MTGVSAAGKTTVSQLLAERIDPSVHVKGDVYRRMVVNGPDFLDPGQLELRYGLGASTANAYFNAGFNVVLQDIIMGPHLPAVVDQITGRPLHVVVLVPRIGVVEAREAGRPKTAYRPDAPAVADLDRYLREQTPRIGLWLDTSEQTPEQTVDEILARRAEAAIERR